MSYACFIYHSRNSLLTYIVLFILAAEVLSLSMSPWNISLKPTLVLFGLYILLQFVKPIFHQNSLPNARKQENNLKSTCPTQCQREKCPRELYSTCSRWALYGCVRHYYYRVALELAFGPRGFLDTNGGEI